MVLHQTDPVKYYIPVKLESLVIRQGFHGDACVSAYLALLFIFVDLELGLSGHFLSEISILPSWTDFRPRHRSLDPVNGLLRSAVWHFEGLVGDCFNIQATAAHIIIYFLLKCYNYPEFLSRCWGFGVLGFWG